MISLYVGSTSGYTGKTLITMGLGRKFQKDGLKIGYIKPIGILPVKVDDTLTDNDAWRIYRALALKDPIHDICPVVLTQELAVKSYLKDVKGLIGKIVKSYNNIAKDKDLMLFLQGLAYLLTGYAASSLVIFRITVIDY